VSSKKVQPLNDANPQKVLKALSEGKPLTIKTYTFLPKSQLYIDQMLEIFLEGLGIPFVMEQISYCVKEMAVNAKKANTKRLYFADKGLNPHDEKDYAVGMKNFKAEMLQKQAYYLRRLKEENLYVKVELLHRKGLVSVAVRNNVPLLPAEETRIREKIAKAYSYNTLEDAFSDMLDESEGAGLGILVLVLMLKKLGFAGDFFQVYTLNGDTVARLILPLSVDIAI
jgi:hypothetical protein